MRVVIGGAGLFGVAAALELARRGHAVTLVDREPPPHPRASSTDISKVIRSDYGSDRLHTELAREAIAHWRRWNAEWSEPPYREVGFLGLAGGALVEGGFEGDSFRLNAEAGARVEHLDRAQLAARFAEIVWPDGEAYLNRDGGWAPSGAVVARLAEEAREAGAAMRVGSALSAIDSGAARLADGTRLEADRVVVAAGAWTPSLVPESAELMRASGQTVVHYAHRGALEALPVWCADIRTSGYYGFPATDGRLKVGRHGAGIEADPERLVEPPAGADAGFRERVERLLPAAAGAAVVERRLCYYCDTTDGDFLIDRVPGRAEVVVAAGGSGHGFKFAPLLGGWIADRVEGHDDRVPARYAWRAPREALEAARSRA